MKKYVQKVRFEFNANEEYEYIKFFEKYFGQINLPKNLRKVWQSKKEAVNFIKQRYNKKKKEEFEKSWGKIEEEYFSKIEKITGYKWQHKKYKVFLSNYIPGFCNPFDVNTDEVVCCQKYKRIERNYIIAHELFHSHYFRIVSKKKNNNFFKTELNENCDILALCFTEIKNLLIKPKDEWIIKFFIKSHPSAEKYFKKLLPIWEKRKNFDDYLKKSLTVLK